MNFKFLLFRKEFLFGFCFCIISLVCVLSYSVWYGVGLNVKWQAQDLSLQVDNVIRWADMESAHTDDSKNLPARRPALHLYLKILQMVVYPILKILETQHLRT